MAGAAARARPARRNPAARHTSPASWPLVRCGPSAWLARAGGPPRRCRWPRRGPRPAAPPGLWPWRGFRGVLALVRPRSPAPGWARSSCGPPPPPGPGLRLPLRGPGPWSVPAPAPCLGLSARALARLGAAGAAPLPARCAAWGRRRAGRCRCAAAPWGGPPSPGPSGPPWVALAALRAALRGVGRPAAAAGSPLRAIPPGFGPRSSAPGGRWPAARACWAALRPPGWRSRAGAPWAIRPLPWLRLVSCARGAGKQGNLRGCRSSARMAEKSRRIPLTRHRSL